MAKILIVEDDANLRMLMTMRLKSKYEHDLVEAVGACAGVDSVNLVSYSGESIG